MQEFGFIAIIQSAYAPLPTVSRPLCNYVRNYTVLTHSSTVYIFQSAILTCRFEFMNETQHNSNNDIRCSASFDYLLTLGTPCVSHVLRTNWISFGTSADWYANGCTFFIIKHACHGWGECRSICANRINCDWWICVAIWNHVADRCSLDAYFVAEQCYSVNECARLTTRFPHKVTKKNSWKQCSIVISI